MGAGVVLLAATGCGQDATSDEAKPELGRATEELEIAMCWSDCESNYNDAYYRCQIGLGDWMCYARAQNELEMCQAFCFTWELEPLPPPEPPPPTSICSTGMAGNDTPGECNEASLNACYILCNACARPEGMGECNQGCLFEFCPMDCYEDNYWECVLGCNSSSDPVVCTDRCYRARCG